MLKAHPSRRTGAPAAPNLWDHETELRGGGAAGGQAPEVDSELPGDGDDDLFAAARAALVHEGLAPLSDGTIGRLVAQEPPGGLDKDMAQAGIAVAVDAALQTGGAGGMLAGAEAGVDRKSTRLN